MPGGRRAVCGFLATAALLATPATAADSLAPVRSLVEGAIEAEEVSSLAVAVLHDGEIVWEEGFGWADVARRLPATARTPYSVASVSKPITATALMILVERRQVELDRPIEDYLGGLTLSDRGGRSEEATVRRVLSHTAGLPLHHRFFFDGEERPPLEETVERYGVVMRPAGRDFRYSNLGYRLLERLIEEVSGHGFADFLDREVFQPLGMSGSAVVTEPDDRGLAVRYDRRGEPIPFYTTEHDGASAVFASAHDLARFGALHLGRTLSDQTEIIGRRSRAEMRRPVAREALGRRAYGLGWMVEWAARGYPVLSHTGGMPGTSSVLIVVPARALAIAVVAGTETPLVQRVAAEILAHYERLGLGGTVAIRMRRGPDGGAARERPPRRVRGSWSGFVEAAGERVPLRLRIERSGEVSAAVGEDGEERRVALPRFDGRSMSGWLRARLPAGDLADRDYVLHLSLERRDGLLRGVVTAQSAPTEALPFALGHWAELRRVE